MSNRRTTAVEPAGDRLPRRYPHPPAAAVAAGIALSGALLVGAEARSARGRYPDTPPPAGPVEMTVAPTRPTDRSAAPVELVALGDSGMAGVGVGEPGETLPALLAGRIADGLLRPVHVVGLGRSGARTADVRTEQVPRIGRPVDACVVMVGTNDVIHPPSWLRLKRDTNDLLGALGALGAPVVFSSLPEFRAMGAVPSVLRPWVMAGAAGARAAQWRAMRDRDDVVYVDVRRAAGGRFVREPALMSADAFHPSAAGYALIADVLAPALVERLKIRLGTPS